MFELKPKVSVQQIKNHVEAGDQARLKESEQRREYLEGLAIMNTGRQVYVQISGDRAYADLADSDSQLGRTDRTIINVRSEIPDQVTTNLDEDQWHFMVQKTDLYHELGHVKWTDWPSFEEVLLGDGDGNYGIVDEHKEMFKVWADYIEDAVIERFLIDQYDIKDDIRITNDNLLKRHKPDKTVSLNQAVVMALVEYKHPVGWIDRLLDETDDEFQFLTDQDREAFEDRIYPAIEAIVPEIIKCADGAARHYACYMLYEHIGIYFDDSVKPGLDEDHSYNFPDDHDNMGDMSPQGGPQQPDQPQDPAQDPGSDPGGVPDINPPDDVDYTDIDQQVDYSQQVQQQQDQMGTDSRVNSVEKWSRIIDNEYDATGTAMSLHIPGIPPSDARFEASRYQEAQQLSTPLAKDLRQRLQQQQRTQKQKKKKSGKVDQSRAHKTQQGKTNIMKKTSDPDDKDYACVIVLDRSGSMSNEMQYAETAATALALALEEVGVEVSQLSMRSGQVQLEKDPVDDVEFSKERMLRDENGGGTPLSDALLLAKARLEQDARHPFAIIITDGEPDHRERYRDILHQCDFPVLGTYLKEGGSFDETHMNESAYFHKLEMREAQDVFKGLKTLVRGVMF